MLDGWVDSAAAVVQKGFQRDMRAAARSPLPPLPPAGSALWRMPTMMPGPREQVARRWSGCAAENDTARRAGQD